jgi:DNA-binding transcriptional ArsR family regulator
LGTDSPTSLSKAIGKPPSTIQYHLNTLKLAGLLVTKGKPPTIRYYIKRDEDIGELKKSPDKISGSASFYMYKTKSI